MDCSPPGSSIHGIFQARILQWVANAFSRGSSGPRDWTRVSCIAGRLFTVWATKYIHAALQPTPPFSPTFSSCPAATLYIKHRLPISHPHPQARATALLLCLYTFGCSGISYKWDYTGLFFCHRLVSLSIMSSRSHHVEACVRIPFLLRLKNILLYVYTTVGLPIHPSTSGHLNRFHGLATVNYAAMNTGAQIFVQVPPYNSFGHISLSRIAGSYGSFV